MCCQCIDVVANTMVNKLRVHLNAFLATEFKLKK